MFVIIFIIVIFIPIAFLPLMLNGLFSPDDLNEMGVDTDLSA